MIDQMQVQAVKSATMSLIERAGAVRVTNDEEYKLVASIRKDEITPALKELDRIFDPSIEQAKAMLATARAAKAEFEEPLKQKLGFCKQVMDNYLTEKARLAREADAKRLAEERQRQQEEMRRQEEERLRRALEAEKAGQEERVNAIMEEKPAPAPFVAPAREITAAAVAPKVAGIVGRRVWTYRIVNPAAVKDEFRILNEALIGKTVRSLHKAAEDVVGGIEAFEEIVT